MCDLGIVICLRGSYTLLHEVRYEYRLARWWNGQGDVRQDRQGIIRDSGCNGSAQPAYYEGAVGRGIDWPLWTRADSDRSPERRFPPTDRLHGPSGNGSIQPAHGESAARRAVP